MHRAQRKSVTVGQRNAKETTNTKTMASDRRKSHENSKRVADESPNNAPTKKRSALGDVTNAHDSKNGKLKPIGKLLKGKGDNKNLTRQSATTNIQTRRRSKELSVSKKTAENLEISTRASSQESRINEPVLSEEEFKSILSASVDEKLLKSEISEEVQDENSTNSALDELFGHDEKSTFNDIDDDITDEFAVSEYANEIFRNMKKREELYILSPYLSQQSKINANMRAILMDWLVEVQENFELYHETLYLSVKIVDHYLQKNVIERDQLQLLGATAVFLACKIEERHPPYLDDFLFICDDAYKKSDLLKMEMKVIADLDYCLAIPIPYRFLRRYAKAGECNMETLTLARYILETSLLEYDYVTIKASKMAAGCLRLAMCMKNVNEWTPTLVHYTGYALEDLSELVAKLNVLIAAQPKKNLKTVYSKYSHSVFFQVAKTPSLDILAM